MHSTPTPKQLQAFNAVAEHGGFTKAAEALGVTQPAVTIQVRMLEKDRRVRLFERRGDGVFLTDAGHSLHAVTRRIFRLIQDADDVLGAADALHFGNLRLGIEDPIEPLCRREPDHALMQDRTQVPHGAENLGAEHQYD